jgi:hypothetical protein
MMTGGGSAGAAAVVVFHWDLESGLVVAESVDLGDRGSPVNPARRLDECPILVPMVAFHRQFQDPSVRERDLNRRYPNGS